MQGTRNAQVLVERVWALEVAVWFLGSSAVLGAWNATRSEHRICGAAVLPET
jgi:hypothetical protein